MRAAHAWDIAGASRARLQTAFVTSLEGPTWTCLLLLEAARTIVER